MTLNMKGWRTVVGTTLLTCSLSLLAATEEDDDVFAQRFKNLGFHLGNLTEFANAVQVDDQGHTRKIGKAPFLGFSTDVEMTPQWALIPEINWVFPQDSNDNQISRNLFMVRLDGGWKGGDWWRLRVGTSVMINNMRGKGGTKTVRNGSGSDSFFIPSESKTSVNNTFDLGAEAFYLPFAVRFQTYTYAIVNSQRRQISWSLTLSYYYDLGKKEVKP